MKHLAFLLFPVVFGSCAPAFYAPNTQNVPMLQEKNEARILVNYLQGSEINGFEAQVAYSPGDHIGLMFNYATGGNGSNTGHQIDGGFGGYMKFSDRFCGEVYGGMAGGHANLEDGDENYTKFFLQPAVGYTTEYFDFIFSTRVGHVNLRGSDNRSRTTGVVEPALTLRAGYKWVKFQAQYCLSYLSNEQDILHENQILSAGLSFSIAPRRNKSNW